MEFRILGPLEVHDAAGRPIELHGARQRALLAALLVHRNEVVPASRLIDELWPDDPPPTAPKMVQMVVSQLRRALGEAHGLETRPPGYVLRVGPEAVDAGRFERLVEESRRAYGAGDAAGAAAELRSALELWRGPPLAELAEHPFARTEAARLEELHLRALEARFEAELAEGRHADLVGELEALVAEHPLRERLRAHLMLALYRSGRQAEALDVYQRTRALLNDELGIEPGRDLQRLERAVLLQDASLDAPAVAAAPAAPVAPVAPAPPAPPVAPSREVRRIVSVVATDVVDLGDARDPEVLRTLVTGALDELADVLERHGGSVERLGGGALRAVFGIPVAHEDDALRASAAALAARRAVAAREPLAVRVGVETGEIVGGGGALVGEAVTLAARLQQVAEPGEILIGSGTERAVRGAGRVEEHGSFSFQGAGRPATRAWRLVAIDPDAPSIARHLDAPIVGRERELDELTARFERVVRERTPALWTLYGPAGIGKSRLAAELRTRIGERATVLSGRCLSYGDGITFWPLAEVVRGAGGASREALAALLDDEQERALVAEHVAATIGLGDAAPTREETFWAVRKLFEALARRRPLVVVLDDVHWAEPTLLDLVEHVADWASDAPILLLALGRPELLEERPSWAGGAPNVGSLRLEALSEQESDALMESLVPEHPLPDDARARIAEAAQGNPLFIEQMVAMISGDGGPPAGELSVPPTLQALIAARIDRLDPEERTVLECASVVGREFWRDAVAELVPAGAQAGLDGRLGQLIRRELLVPAPTSFPGHETLRFRHLLIRDVVYDSLPKQARAGLHERFAVWMERMARQRGVGEILGYHFEQAYRYRAELGPVGPAEHALAARAAEEFAVAGRRACTRGDMVAGVSLLTRALDLTPDASPASAELLTDLGEAYRESGDFAAAETALADAIATASALDAPAVEAEARVIQVRLRAQVDPNVGPRDIVRVAEEAIARLQELDDERRLAKAWFVLAWGPWLQGDVATTEAALQRAIEYARRSGDERTEAQSLNLFLGTGFFGPTPVPEAVRRCEDVLGRVSAPQRLAASAARALAGLRALEGSFDNARRLAAHDRAILERLGLKVSAAMAAEVYGLIELLAGDPAAAERELRAGYETLEQLGETNMLANLAAMLGQALYAQGRDEEALGFTEVSERATTRDDLAPQVQWRAARAKIVARLGRGAEAERLAHEAVTLAERTPDFLQLHADALVDLGEVHERSGNRSAAAAALQQALDLYERKGNVTSAARARAALASLADDGRPARATPKSGSFDAGAAVA